MIAAKATMGTVTDMEPLLRSMLLEQKRIEGKAGDVSAEEVAAAASTFGNDIDQTSSTAADEVRETMERSLPKGVRVEKISASREGTRVTSTTTFALDDIRLLPELEVFFERGRPSQKPFAAFALSEAKDALVVDGMPPPFSVSAHAPTEAMKKSAVTLALEVALPVVESNATRADAGRLVWEIDAARLTSRKADEKGWIHVKYALS